MQDFISQLDSGRALTEAQVQAAVAELANEAVTVELKADFLSALARKGESIGEIVAFAAELRTMSVPVPLDERTRDLEILDVVGTGGDKLNTFNISSTAALLCAAAGVTVAKHGNRAATSASGSADVLEALGIPLNLSPADAATRLREQGFAFFFAPNYHPAFKHIAPARKLCAARGQRTIFNFLGPLLNPVRPTAMLLGVPRPEMCEPIARALQSLGVRRAMVVCGEVPGEVSQPLTQPSATLPTSVPVAADVRIGVRQDSPPPHVGGYSSGEHIASLGGSIRYLDEISTLGEATVAEFYQERGFTVSKLSPENFPLQPATLADLVGGDKLVNAETARRILSGDERGPKRDAVLINAAAALFIAGRCKSLVEGWDLAESLISSGAARAKLDQLTRV